MELANLRLVSTTKLESNLMSNPILEYLKTHPEFKAIVKVRTCHYEGELHVIPGENVLDTLSTKQVESIMTLTEDLENHVGIIIVTLFLTEKNTVNTGAWIHPDHFEEFDEEEINNLQQFLKEIQEEEELAEQETEETETKATETAEDVD